jgi:hypothetical protein
MLAGLFIYLAPLNVQTVVDLQPSLPILPHRSRQHILGHRFATAAAFNSAATTTESAPLQPPAPPRSSIYHHRRTFPLRRNL